jgi:hypothetical protein
MDDGEQQQQQPRLPPQQEEDEQEEWQIELPAAGELVVPAAELALPAVAVEPCRSGSNSSSTSGSATAVM